MNGIAFFAVRPTREATALDDLLGDDFQGVVSCDRAKMYWRPDRLQWCWAHLKRDFQAMIDSGDRRAKWLGERLRAATCKLFEHWGDYRAGKISPAALARRMALVRCKAERLLLRGMQTGPPGVRGTCRELYKHRRWLWAFLRHEGVVPTNNANEQCRRAFASPCGDLAKAVVWDAELPWQPVCRNDADGDRDLPPTMPQRLHFHHQRCSSPSLPSINAFTAPQGVNGYHSSYHSRRVDSSQMPCVK